MAQRAILTIATMASLFLCTNAVVACPLNDAAADGAPVAVAAADGSASTEAPAPATVQSPN